MTKRLSVNLPDDTWTMLNAIADRYGVAVTEAVRRALTTEWFLITEVDSGSRVMLDGAGGELREIVFRDLMRVAPEAQRRPDVELVEDAERDDDAVASPARHAVAG